MSFVGLMLLPHWKSNLQAMRYAPLGQHPHDPNPFSKEVLTATTSGLLVAHAGPAQRPWAGSRPWGGVRWGGAGGAHLAPVTVGHSTATALLPGSAAG